MGVEGYTHTHALVCVGCGGDWERRRGRVNSSGCYFNVEAVVCECGGGRKDKTHTVTSTHTHTHTDLEYVCVCVCVCVCVSSVPLSFVIITAYL